GHPFRRIGAAPARFRVPAAGPRRSGGRCSCQATRKLLAGPLLSHSWPTPWSLEQRLLVPIGRMAVPVLLVVLPLDLIPVYQLDRRPHDAGERGPSDGLEALAGARGRLVFAAVKLLRATACSFHDQGVETVGNQ